MDHLVVTWYAILSGWTQGAVFALQAWAGGLGVPLLSALVFGLMGAGAVGAVAGSVRRLERPFRIAAALLLVLAGLYDTVVYWTLG